MITKETIMEAYLFMRKENQSVPSETLEFMKDTALAELEKSKVKNLPMHGVSGISLEQLKLQKEVYRERKESNGKATAYGEAHTDEIREGVIDHLIALCNYR